MCAFFNSPSPRAILESLHHEESALALCKTSRPVFQVDWKGGCCSDAAGLSAAGEHGYGMDSVGGGSPMIWVGSRPSIAKRVKRWGLRDPDPLAQLIRREEKAGRLSLRL